MQEIPRPDFGTICTFGEEITIPGDDRKIIFNCQYGVDEKGISEEKAKAILLEHAHLRGADYYMWLGKRAGGRYDILLHLPEPEQKI